VLGYAYHFVAVFRKFDEMEIHKLLEVILELSEECEGSLFLWLASEVFFKGVKARVELLRRFVLSLEYPFKLGSNIGLETGGVLDKGKGPFLKVRPVFLHVSEVNRPLFFEVSVPSLPAYRFYIAESTSNSLSFSIIFPRRSFEELG
jgi:hypothetical protein